MTRFHPWRLRPLLCVGLLTLGAAAPGLVARAAAVCAGDCNGDGRVSIAEAQACVNLAAGLPAPACAAADQNLDGHVDSNEVDACIQSFLDAATCPMVFTPVPTPPSTSTPVNTNTPVHTNTPLHTSTPLPTNTATAAPTSTQTPKPTATAAPTNTAVPPCPLNPGTYTVTQTAGGTLNAYIFPAFPFPAGGTISEEVQAASPPECVHDVVVPFPGGFVAPTFCVPALNLTTQVLQRGCGIGKLDSNGGSDFDTNEIADSSDGAVCMNHQATCAGGTDTHIRVDVTVGNGTPDSCGAVANGMNALVSVPVHTTSWADNTPDITFNGCPGDGVFNGTDSVAATFDQILDFTTATAKGKWMDLDGDGCALATGSFGPAAGFTVTGTCIDPAKVNTASVAVTTVATGEFGSTGPGFDGGFTTTLPNTISGPTASTGATCASPPLVPASGNTATRCIP